MGIGGEGEVDADDDENGDDDAHECFAGDKAGGEEEAGAYGFFWGGDVGFFDGEFPVADFLVFTGGAVDFFEVAVGEVAYGAAGEDGDG